MAWVAPRTWIVNEVVTAAELNTHIRDNELYLKSQTDLILGPVTRTSTGIGTSGLADVNGRLAISFSSPFPTACTGIVATSTTTAAMRIFSTSASSFTGEWASFNPGWVTVSSGTSVGCHYVAFGN